MFGCNCNVWSSSEMLQLFQSPFMYSSFMQSNVTFFVFISDLSMRNGLYLPQAKLSGVHEALAPSEVCAMLQSGVKASDSGIALLPVNQIKVLILACVVFFSSFASCCFVWSVQVQNIIPLLLRRQQLVHEVAVAWAHNAAQRSLQLERHRFRSCR